MPYRQDMIWSSFGCIYMHILKSIYFEAGIILLAKEIIWIAGS